MNYDLKSLELAKYFLADYRNLIDPDKSEQELAQDIQVAVEMWFESSLQDHTRNRKLAIGNPVAVQALKYTPQGDTVSEEIWLPATIVCVSPLAVAFADGSKMILGPHNTWRFQ